MWTNQIELLKTQDGLRVRIAVHAKPMSYEPVALAWQEDAGFQDFFSTALADSPFVAFRWEAPRLINSSRLRPFECAVLNSPELTGTLTRRRSQHISRLPATSGWLLYQILGACST